MLVRFKQPLIVNAHNHVEGDVARLHDEEQAKRLISEGAVEIHTPDADSEDDGGADSEDDDGGQKREAVANPTRTRKAVRDV